MHRSIGFALLLGCGGTAAAPSPDPSPSRAELRWRDVTSGAELADLAAEAHAGRRGLMLDVRADWCVPCRELESKTFTDPGLRDLLGREFVLARLDVTDATPEAEALQMRVGGAAMPWVVFWSMTPRDAEAFANGQLPPPAKTVSTFVSAQELLPLVDAIGRP